MNNPLKNLLVFVFILFVFFVWFFREIFQGYLFYFSDLTYYFYPYRHYLVESVKSGYFPLWNPYIFAGYPFFATLQTWTLYPITALFYLLPFDLAFNLSIIIHYPLAFIFTYLLCRELKMSRWAALISGFVFAFSGFLLSVLHMPTTLAPAVWIPPLIIFMRRAFLSEDFSDCFKNTILSSFFLSLMFLGGEPTVLLSVILFVFFYLCYDGFVRKRKGFFRNVIILSSAGLIFVLLVSVQLFPFLELIFNSVRSHGISFSESTYWSLGPQKLLSFLIPYFFHSDAYTFSTFEWTKSFYLGIIPILLMICSFVFVKNKRFLFIALLVSFLLAFGSKTPFFWFFYKLVPFFGFIRYPQKFVLISTFLISLLAGFGFDGLCFEMQKRGSIVIDRFLKYFLFVILVFFVVFLVLHSYHGFAEKITRALFFEDLTHNKNINIGSIYQRNTINLGIQCLFLIVVWIIIKKFVQSGRIVFFKYLIVFLLVLDVFLANYGLCLSIRSRDYHQSSPVIDYLQKDKGLFRVGVSPVLGNAKTVWIHDEVIKFEKSIVDFRNILIENQSMLYNLSMLSGYESIADPDVLNIKKTIAALNPKTPEFADIDLLNLMNFKYLLTNHVFKVRGYTLVLKDKMKLRDMDVFLYKNKNYFPRVMVLPKYRVIEQREDILKHISSVRYFGRTEAVLEEKIPGLDFSKNIASRRFYRVNIEKYSPSVVKIKASLEQPGILLLSDHYYPGWNVYVDGKKGKIYRGNYMFRAVPLGKGEYNIVFSYEPLIFNIGLTISSLSLFFCLGILIFLSRKNHA